MCQEELAGLDLGPWTGRFPVGRCRLESEVRGGVSVDPGSRWVTIGPEARICSRRRRSLRRKTGMFGGLGRVRGDEVSPCEPKVVDASALDGFGCLRKY